MSRCYASIGLTCPRPRRAPCESCLAGGTRIAYAFERIASVKVTIRPRTSSHSAWRDARNPSARVRTRRHREARMRTVAGFQPIVGNPRRNMVDVVETDIPSRPLQQAWQPEKRAATQRRVNRVPLNMSRPVRPIELVLQ